MPANIRTVTYGATGTVLVSYDTTVSDDTTITVDGQRIAEIRIGYTSLCDLAAALTATQREINDAARLIGRAPGEEAAA